MKVRQVNSILWITTACCIALGALSLGLGVTTPLKIPSAEQAIAVAPPRAATTNPVPDPFEQIASRRFRASPNDGPAVAKTAGSAPTAGAPSPSTPVLVGTIGNSLAMFRMPDGSIALKGVGDELEGASVVAIRPEQVDLQSNTKRTTVSKQNSPAPPGISLEGAHP